jgi:hypothetical protein
VKSAVLSAVEVGSWSSVLTPSISSVRVRKSTQVLGINSGFGNQLRFWEFKVFRPIF